MAKSEFKRVRRAISAKLYEKIFAEETKKALQEWGNYVVDASYNKIVKDWENKPYWKAEVRETSKHRFFVYFRIRGSDLAISRWNMVDTKGRHKTRYIDVRKPYRALVTTRSEGKHLTEVKKSEVVRYRFPNKRMPIRKYFPSTGPKQGQWGGPKQYAPHRVHFRAVVIGPGEVHARHFNKYIQEYFEKGRSSNSNINKLFDARRARFDLAVRRARDRTNRRHAREAK